MTEEVNHLHLMETGLWELWLHSHAMWDIIKLYIDQELVRYQEIGITITQNA